MTPARIETIPCPLCAADDYTRLYQLDGWYIVRCRKCQFVYVNPRLEKKILDSLYTRNYFDNTEFGYYHYQQNEDLRKRNFLRWVSDSLPYLQNKTDNALDIGCAAGYCLEILQQQGFQPEGIELDKQFVSDLRQKGYTIYDTKLVDTVFEKRYSLITLFDVIEHLTDLHENFAKLHSLLEEKGIVVIITPDYDSTQRKWMGKKWFQFKPVEHINYFTKETLERLARQNGLQVLHVEKAGQYANATFLHNRLKSYGLNGLSPFVRAAFWLSGRAKRYFYVDTASLYVILSRRDSSSGAGDSPKSLS